MKTTGTAQFSRNAARPARVNNHNDRTSALTWPEGQKAREEEENANLLTGQKTKQNDCGHRVQIKALEII